MQIIEHSGYQIEFHRGGVKNINLRVYPEEQRIRVSAPRRMPLRLVRGFISSKEDWIYERMEKGKEIRRKIEKKWERGSGVQYRGREYTLRLADSDPGVEEGFEEDSGSLILRKRKSAAEYEQAVDIIYRSYLKGRIPEIISAYSEPMGVHVNEFGVRKMKTRWGSCNIRARRIWLNLSLAAYPDRSLEYVVVHEMTHLLEKYHNKRFYSFLDRYFPEWKEVEKELNGRQRFLKC